MSKCLDNTKCIDDNIKIVCFQSKNASSCENDSNDANFAQKAKKLLNKKFVINSQFDQDGTNQFLHDKFESLKEIFLDETIIENKQKNRKSLKETNDSNKKKNSKAAKAGYKNAKQYMGLSSFVASTQTLKQIIEEMNDNFWYYFRFYLLFL